MDGISQWHVTENGAATVVRVGNGPHQLDSHAPGYVWLHVDTAREGARTWLEAAGLDPLILRALLAPETRPRCTSHGDGVLMNLRGVNLNPGDEVEDMISLRMWVTEKLVISVQLRQLQAVVDVLAGLERGQGAEDPAELVARLALRLADRAEPVVAGLNEKIDVLEDQVIDGVSSMVRFDLGSIRRVSIMLRRHMAPQRDALSTFEIEELAWLKPEARPRLREATERMTRLAEELDAIRDRAQVVQDQIMDSRAEAMNRQMLILSVVAAIFLPLGLITGLLGINVGGMPGADNPLAFWIVTGGLVVIGLLLVWVFRRIGMLGK
ncbi:zinc transporter ZntB [uncultured Roseovarius sp.]|uniref:zinc transporter ZntB n=1 Tax=uncultured Roseovarius sp. TaxID=293344 RepID=UPI00260DC5FA|nr:zinc transporter ZntB [uncultured Roseovarius sp.]